MAGQNQANSDRLLTAPVVDFPRKATINPLSMFSSYTYNLALYMVTPDKYNQFVKTGGVLTRDGQVFVVCQSGGINNRSETRALTTETGIGYDYYMDDLNIQMLLPGGADGASVGTTMSFKIYETNGFTFTQELSRASTKVNQASELLKNNPVKPNSMQQCYIIGVRFYGYDVNGNLVSEQNNPLPSQYKTNFNSDKNAVLERFFPIQINTMKFKLDGRMVVYNFEAVILGERASCGEINGIVKSACQLTGSTVKDVLIGNGTTAKTRGLVQLLNEVAADQKDRNVANAPSTYKITINDSAIETAKLVDDASFAAQTAPMRSASSADKTTIAESYKAVSIDPTSKTISISAGTPILSVIDNIIVKSSYISEALKESVNEAAAPVGKQTPVIKPLSWYSINPIATVKTRDEKLKNWTYNIEYQISKFEVAYIRSQYVAAVSKFVGPTKEYNYWFTGKNSEVLSYEQTYDNLYYIIDNLTVNSSPDSNNTNSPTGTQNGSQGDQTAGKQNKGSMINNNVRVQLYSPSDLAMAKMRIMGDPDYLMTAVGVSQSNSTTNFQKFTGPGGSISPYGGQVFVQLKFNTASDYSNDGLMTVNNQIQFYETDAVSKAGIEGIVYRVQSVDTVFAAGKFTQTLHMILVPSTSLITSAKPGENTQRAESAATGAKAPTSSGRGDGNLQLASEQARRAAEAQARKAQLPQPSSAKGVQQELNPGDQVTDPTAYQIENSLLYKQLVRANVPAPEAYNKAKAALQGGQSSNDDQRK